MFDMVGNTTAANPAQAAWAPTVAIGLPLLAWLLFSLAGTNTGMSLSTVWASLQRSCCCWGSSAVGVVGKAESASYIPPAADATHDSSTDATNGSQTVTGSVMRSISFGIVPVKRESELELRDPVRLTTSG